MKTIKLLFITLLALVVYNPIWSQTAHEYYNQGNKHLDQKEYTESIQSFDAAIELNTGFSKAFLRRGVAKLYNEEYFGAIEDFDKVIELEPDNYEAYWYRSKVKEIIGDTMGANKDKTVSENLLDKSKDEEDLGFD